MERIMNVLESRHSNLAEPYYDGSSMKYDLVFSQG
jgi:hypothetical protein